MRKFVISAIGLCILYFILGWIAVQFNWLSSANYTSYGVIVGVLACILGWLAYIFPESMAETERRVAEVETLRDISHTLEGRKDQEQELATDEEIAVLASRKAEIEALVRKSSLILFMHDQLSRHQARIVPMVESHTELSQLLSETRSLKKDLSELGEEVASDENVDFLNDIIEKETMKDRYASLDTWEKYLLISLKFIFQAAKALLLRPSRR